MFIRDLLIVGVITILLCILVVPADTTDFPLRLHNEKLVKHGNTLYVGGTGPNNYTRIQDAINDSEDGYTIYVYYGIYNESIVINKSISLIGIKENRTKPVIDGRGKKFAVNITSDGCIVKSFEIMNYEGKNEWYYGIRINSINNFIENNTILCDCIGVSFYYSSNNTISRNTISESKERNAAIELRHSDNNTITENEIKFNEEDGIFLRDSCGNIISMNKVSRNGCGILIFSYSDNNIISYNEVYRNTFYGISIQGGSHNKVIGNNVYRNRCGIGITKSWSFHNLISNNTVSSNNRGIALEGIGNTISRNNITHNSKCGISLDFFGSSKINFITKNNLIENGINAEFRVRILSFNIWYKNYWSDWSLPIPKPISGRLRIYLGPFFWLEFPWINFDWRPVTTPYDI